MISQGSLMARIPFLTFPLWWKLQLWLWKQSCHFDWSSTMKLNAVGRASVAPGWIKIGWKTCLWNVLLPNLDHFLEYINCETSFQNFDAPWNCCSGESFLDQKLHYACHIKISFIKTTKSDVKMSTIFFFVSKMIFIVHLTKLGDRYSIWTKTIYEQNEMKLTLCLHERYFAHARCVIRTWNLTVI